MFNWIVRASLHNRLFVLAVAALLMIYGALDGLAHAGRCLSRPQQADWSR